MDADTRKLIERLHASPTMAVVAVAGAGSKAIDWLLSVPGASQTVLEALVPYAPTSLADFLGYQPGQYVNVGTATDMARAAYRRAVQLRNSDAPVVGIGCTAAIATDRRKRGEHHCHVAAWKHDGTAGYSLQFVKGLRARAGEGAIVSKLVVKALAEASEIDARMHLDLDDTEELEAHGTRYDDPIKALLAQQVSSVTVRPDGTMVADEPVVGGVLPGSFNPLHEGHERLADATAAIVNTEVTFELSIENVDKPRLEEPEIRRRVAQFAGKGRVVLTRALVFHQKAKLFPGATFVIGWDTAVRLVDPRYYGGENHKLLGALDEIRERRCSLLVAGRVDGGSFQTLADIIVPEGFEEVFTPIPESAFRCDLSSTELRLAGTRP